MNLALISHPDCLLHNNGSIAGMPHPENAGRITAIQDQLIAQGIDPWLIHIDAPLATRAQLLRVHDAHYVDDIFNSIPEQGLIRFDQDVTLGPHSLNAALRAAGSGIAAVDWVMDQGERRAFCAIRPPGHHAGRRNAAGFCIFNNVAVAAYHALENHHLKRVAIVDFDVHHGDGTENIVAGDPRILFCSSFQHPYYPYRGLPAAAENCLPVPVDRGTLGPAWRAAVAEAWFDRLAAFAPELIVISAGFDSHIQDDMGGLGLVEADYVWLTEALIRIARIQAGGRVVSLLEGGYEYHALARSVAAHITALQD